MALPCDRARPSELASLAWSLVFRAASICHVGRTRAALPRDPARPSDAKGRRLEAAATEPKLGAKLRRGFHISLPRRAADALRAIELRADHVRVQPLALVVHRTEVGVRAARIIRRDAVAPVVAVERAAADELVVLDEQPGQELAL